jgi:hypothetical protein
LYANNIFPWSTRLDLSWDPQKTLQSRETYMTVQM